MKIISLLVVLSFMSLVSCKSLKKDIEKTGKAKNIILLIGDGMGVAQIYAAMSVSDDTLCLEKFRHIGFHKTYSATDYITDSGAGGTALSTGVKTCNYCIAVDTMGNPLKTILEYAEYNHLATGLISTSAITHATPASFISHESDRTNYENIALDFLNVDIDLFIGGGKKHFTERADGLNLVDSLQIKGYSVFDSIEDLNMNQLGKIAVFTSMGHNPEISKGRGNLLAQSTEKALNVLSRSKQGFFLMVEGSQIDWGGHDNDIDYVTSELIDFDKAIAKAIEFAKLDGETLVIVTADHETGGLTLIGGNVTQKTIQAGFSTDDHTAVMVPVFAFGPGAENFGGIYENTDVFVKMMNAFGFKK